MIVKQKGLTLIEIMIAVVVVLIILMVAAGFVGQQSSNSTVSWGVNGATELRCIDGYRFIISRRGETRQVMDEFGKGLKCQ